MSSKPVKNRCPPTCPKVRKQLRAALAEAPWLADGIFPRKKNDVRVRLPPDDSKDVRDGLEPIEVDHDERIGIDVPAKAVEDVTEAKPIEEERIVEIIEEQPVIPIEKITDLEQIDLIKKEELIEEPSIIEEQPMVPTEKIIDHDVQNIDLIEETELIEPTIISEQLAVPAGEITEREIEKINLVKEKELIQQVTDLEERPLMPTEERADDVVEKIVVEERPVIPTEKMANDIVEEVDLIEEPTVIQERPIIPAEKVANDIEKTDIIEEKEIIQESTIIREQPVTLTETVADNDVEKVDLVEDVKLIQEPIITEEKPLATVEKIADNGVRKIDLVKEKIPVPEKTVMEPAKEAPVTNEKPKIVAEEAVEPKKRTEDHDIKKEEEEEEVLTGYERFIDEEMEKSLPGAIAEEIPEEPRIPRRTIPKTTTVSREKDNHKRPIRPKEREVREIEESPIREATREDPIISRRAERGVPREPMPEEAEDACDRTCSLAKEQKGFRYFEDVCACSLACMVYSLSRDPFVKSILASLTLFAVGLKLCSELDAWEMPSRVS